MKTTRISLAATLMFAAMMSPVVMAQGEGIKVNGDWTIEVRQPDGTLVERREFRNGLVGANVLSRLLGGNWVVGSWSVLIQRADATAGWPCGTGAIGSFCNIVDKDFYPLNGVADFNVGTLSITQGVESIELNGSFTAARDTVLGSVQTSVLVCNTTPCTYPNLVGTAALTYKAFDGTAGAPLPIHVDPGQFVQVKVTLSFQ